MTEFGDCCKTGFKWDGTPTGKEGKLAENNAYIAGTNKEAAVLLIHDIFGWTLLNLRLLADHFAKEPNVTVYLPDFFGGEVIPEKTLDEAFADPARMALADLPTFLGRNSKEIRGPELLATARALRASYNKVGVVGYCYGGWASFHIAAKGNNLVDCITVAHPALVEKSEIDALAVPTQILAPEIDTWLTPDLKEYANTVIPGLGIPYRYDYYPSLTHGFAAKGDPKDPKQKEGFEKAKRAAVTWLNEYLH